MLLWEETSKRQKAERRREKKSGERRAEREKIEGSAKIRVPSFLPDETEALLLRDTQRQSERLSSMLRSIQMYNSQSNPKHR